MPNGVVVVVAADDKTGEVFNAVKKHLDETKEKANQTNSALGSIGNALRGGLQTAGLAVGLQQIVSGIERVVGASTQMGVEINHLSQQTGISAQNLSVLRYAASQTGVDFETLTKGFKKLAVNVFEADNGNKTAAKGFNILGISVAELKAKGDDMYGIMGLIADKFQAMPDGITKSAAASEIFGARMGSQLIPLLNQGSAALQKFKSDAEALGIVLDQLSAKKLEDLHKALEQTKASFDGLGLTLTSSISPVLTDVTNRLTKMLIAMREVGAADVLLHSWTSFSGSNFDVWLNQMLQAIKMHDRVRDLIAASAKDIFAGATRPVGELDKDEKPVKPVNLDGAEQRAEDSRRALADAVSKVDEARAKSDAELSLAILDSLHKQQLVSDAAYFSQKQSIQTSAFDAERAALQRQQLNLADQINITDAKHPKDAKARLENEAQLNGLKQKTLELDTKVLDLDSRQAQKATEIASARAEALERQRNQVAQVAAELESLGGSGASKAIAEARLKAGEERTKLSNGGASSQEMAQFDALEKLKEAKLQVEALDRQGEVIRRTADLAEAKVMQAELAHAISQKESDTQLNAIRGNELVQLQALSRAYLQYGEAGLNAEAKVQGEITQTMQAMEKQAQEINQTVQQVAHSIFDPLFDMGEKWQKKWQSITKGLERDLSQFTEKQLFGALFGDDAAGGKGQGGKGGGFGAPGGHGRAGLGGVEGLVGNALGGLFGKKPAGLTSNGGLGGGAGTIADSAASLLQTGKGAGSAGGGIQVVLNNQGPPMQVDQSSQQTGDGGESQVIQIMLKQLETNGPVAQGIAGLFH